MPLQGGCAVVQAQLRLPPNNTSYMHAQPMLDCCALRVPRVKHSVHVSNIPCNKPQAVLQIQQDLPTLGAHYADKWLSRVSRTCRAAYRQWYPAVCAQEASFGPAETTTARGVEQRQLLGVAHNSGVAARAGQVGSNETGPSTGVAV